MRCSMTGTTTRTRARWRSTSSSVPAGSKRRRHDHRGVAAQTHHQVAEGPRRGTSAPPRRSRPAPAAGCVRAPRRRPSMALTSGRRAAPFGRPVVPDVRMTVRPWWRVGAAARPLVAGRRPCSASPRSGDAGRGGRHIGQLGVVHQDAHALGPGHVGQLRPGEAGVHEHEVGLGLGHRDHGLHEASVVAAQHADRRAPPRAQLAQPAGDAVGAPPQLAVGEGALVVDDGVDLGVAGAGGGEGPRRAERPTARRRRWPASAGPAARRARSWIGARTEAAASRRVSGLAHALHPAASGQVGDWQPRVPLRLVVAEGG